MFSGTYFILNLPISLVSSQSKFIVRSVNYLQCLNFSFKASNICHHLISIISEGSFAEITEFKLAACGNNHMSHVRSEYLKSQRKLNCNRLYGKYLMLMYFMESCCEGSHVWKSKMSRLLNMATRRCISRSRRERRLIDVFVGAASWNRENVRLAVSIH